MHQREESAYNCGNWSYAFYMKKDIVPAVISLLEKVLLRTVTAETSASLGEESDRKIRTCIMTQNSGSWNLGNESFVLLPPACEATNLRPPRLKKAVNITMESNLEETSWRLLQALVSCKKPRNLVRTSRTVPMGVANIASVAITTSKGDLLRHVLM